MKGVLVDHQLKLHNFTNFCKQAVLFKQKVLLEKGKAPTKFEIYQVQDGNLVLLKVASYAVAFWHVVEKTKCISTKFS